MTNVLSIGPLGSSLGNTANGLGIPYKEFTDILMEHYPSSEVIYLPSGLSVRSLLILCKAILKSFIYGLRGDLVFLHLSWKSYKFFIIVLMPILLLRRDNRIVIRKFAGDFDHRFSSIGRIGRWFFCLVSKRVGFFFFETKYLVEWSNKNFVSAYWWPNSRKATTFTGKPVLGSKQCLVFMGRICFDKGCEKILKIAEMTSDDLDFRFYGPIDKSFKNMILASTLPKNVSFHGSYAKSDIPKILASAFALLLPTSWRSEGYPGVIIEAAQAGVPSIVSSSRGPAELVQLLRYGVIVDNFLSVDEFRRAIKSLNKSCNANGRIRLARNARLLGNDDTYYRIMDIIGEKKC